MALQQRNIAELKMGFKSCFSLSAACGITKGLGLGKQSTKLNQSDAAQFLSISHDFAKLLS